LTPAISPLSLHDALPICFDLQRMLQFSVTQNFDSSNVAAHELPLAKQFFVHNRASLEFIQVAQINDRVGRMKSSVIETALRQTPNQRHLSAFEPETNAAARPRLVTFVAFAAGFSVTRAFAATKSLNSLAPPVAR